MSLCLCLQMKHMLFIGGDSRLSEVVDGVTIKKHDKFQKLRVVGNKVIFGGGMSGLFDLTISDFEKSSDQSVQNLRTIALKYTHKFLNEAPEEKIYLYIDEYGKLISTCLIVAEFLDGLPVFHQILSSNDFNVIVKNPPEEDGKLNYFCAGVYTDEAVKIVSECGKLRLPPPEIFRKTYSGLVNQSIGGNLTVYMMAEYDGRIQIIKMIDEKIEGVSKNV